MRFAKVKYEAFERDMMLYKPISFLGNQTKEIYDSIQLPKRKTKNSAGYDICIPIDIVIPPGERRVVPTGIKVVFDKQEMTTWHLQIYVRSSIGIKDGVVLTNGTGIVDSDYQFAENDGDMMLPLMNTGDKTVKYKAGDRICQAVFAIHGLTVDDDAKDLRTGGIGSTGKK